MKNIIFFLSFLFNSCFAQITIWNGFEQQWTYNHRVNRIGSYVLQDSKLFYHTAATGIGPNKASIKSFYAQVSSPTSYTFQDSITLSLNSKENEEIDIVKKVTGFLPSTTDSIKWITCLSGFDLISNQDADKIQNLSLKITDLKIYENVYNFNLRINARFNCQSLECKCFNQKVNYKLKIFYSFVGDKYLTYKPLNLANDYLWNKKSKVKYSSKFYDIKMPETSFPVITGFSIDLNKAHWFYNISMSLDGNTRYNLFFGQNYPEMKKKSYSPKHSKYSALKSGYATLSLNTQWINIPNSKIKYKSLNSSIIWKGKNKKPNSNASMIAKKI